MVNRREFGKNFLLFFNKKKSIFVEKNKKFLYNELGSKGGRDKDEISEKNDRNDNNRIYFLIHDKYKKCRSSL